jgi:hypothetical protein
MSYETLALKVGAISKGDVFRLNPDFWDSVRSPAFHNS